MMRLPLALALTCGLGCATTGAGSKALVSEWIPFDASNGMVIMNVQINGAPAKAMLDSGAGLSLISKAFCDANGIEAAGARGLTVRGVSGTKRLSVANDFRVDFVGERGAGGAVQIAEAVILEHRPGGADLILGLRFFRGFVVQIDYPRRKLRYMTRSATKLDAVANVEARKAYVDGPLLAKIRLHDAERWLMVDTGNSGSIFLPRRTAKLEGWLQHASTLR